MADTNTIVGQTILIKGNLQGDEDLTVQGRIEGSVHLSKTLIVEPTGVVKAEVSVCNAVISGIMVGNVNATESVELTESGRMIGDIRAPRVIITEGARFKGQVDMGDVAASARESAARPQAVKPARFEPPRKASAPTARPTPVAAKPVPVRAEPKVEARIEKKELDDEEAASKKKVVVRKRR